MKARRPRKLDLNAPLLSTRRCNICIDIELVRTSSFGHSFDRVPFSWEQSPGKPKDMVIKDNAEEKSLPLPKPPPIRCQEGSNLAYNDMLQSDFGDDTDDQSSAYGGHNGIDNTNDDNFSSDNTIDLFSLAGSLNTSEKQEEENVHEDLDSESESRNRKGSASPDFMIQRFLPAATALAASSLSALANGKDLRCTSNMNGGSCVPRVASEAYSSSKGCWLELLFPWRAKHRLCGIKSPIRSVPSRLKSSSTWPKLS